MMALHPTEIQMMTDAYRPCAEWRALYRQWIDTGAAQRHQMDLRAACECAVRDVHSEKEWLDAAHLAIFYGEPLSRLDFS